MGRWRDFFGALSRNPYGEDEAANEELNQFISENSESAKRISDMEKKLYDSMSTSSRAPKTQLRKGISSKKAEPKVRQVSMEEKEVDGR